MIEEAAAEIRADGINQLLATSEIEVEMREFIYHGLKALEPERVTALTTPPTDPWP